MIGETCDVAANVLPCSTLTSLGISVSGEAFPDLIRHLTLDGTYENQMLAELILHEAQKIGGLYFARHLQTSDWRQMNWRYLDHRDFEEADYLTPRTDAQRILEKLFKQVEFYRGCDSFRGIIHRLNKIQRSPFDKLPNQFEFINASFSRKMSFRSWRDIQRQGFCTHFRTKVTPALGFYHYDKPAPKELKEMFDCLHLLNVELWELMEQKQIPLSMRQYPMAMGNLVGFDISGNLLQWEFVNWQRTKFSVNHEVRKIVLSIEKALREKYPWWSEISRADMTSAYICARGSSGVPLV